MSLVAFALRTCVVRALRGATLAGPNVFDSPVDPSDTAASAATPTIFVYSDSEHLQNMTTRGLGAGDRTVDLSLLIVLPAKFQATVGGVTVEFQDRKAGAAAAIDILYRQIERALVAEETVWSRLWNVFVVKIVSLTAHAYVLPVGSGAQSRHLPARAVSLAVEPLNSPPLGQTPDGIWADFISAMEGDPGLAPVAPLIAAAIEGAALPQWRTDAIYVGDTVEDAIDMGYGPLGGGATDELVPVAEVTVRQAVPGAAETALLVGPDEDPAWAR